MSICYDLCHHVCKLRELYNTIISRISYCLLCSIKTEPFNNFCIFALNLVLDDYLNDQLFAFITAWTGCMWLHGSISCFMSLCGSRRGNHGMVLYDKIKHLNMNFILCSDFIYNTLIYIGIQPNLLFKTVYPFITSTNSNF